MEGKNCLFFTSCFDSNAFLYECLGKFIFSALKYDTVNLT